MGFGQGLSGLRAQSQKLDVIGNNIANSGTVGFKASSVSFADVYASSRVGLGTQVAAVNQNFGVGTISTTGGQFDMAIDGGAGLFRVVDSNGNVLYTRNGEFHANKEGFIVNAQGYRLTGYEGDSTTPTPIRVPTGNIAPQSTTRVESKVNLDSTESAISRSETLGVFRDVDNDVTYYFRRDATTGNLTWADQDGTPGGPAPSGTIESPNGPVAFGAGGQPIDFAVFDAAISSDYSAVGVAFDPLEPSSFHHYLPVTVYDSQGNPYQLAQYFTKTGPNQWEVTYAVPAEDPNDPAAVGGMVVIHNDTLQFSGAGLLTSAPTIDLSDVLASYTGVDVEQLNITVNYAGSTQYNSEFAYDFNQNGFPTGEYSSMSVAPNGEIVASYTNGETQVMGYLTLANFTNVQGLQPVGGNAWRETSESGQPILGRPGTNGMAMIKGQSLEESNVDMGTELVNMIITQRAYQANAQTISTQSEMLQTLINIR